jgi:hypothetical protein
MITDDDAERLIVETERLVHEVITGIYDEARVRAAPWERKLLELVRHRNKMVKILVTGEIELATKE